MDARFGHRWSKSEDSNLEKIVRNCLPLDWHRVAREHDPWSMSRTPDMCRNRWTQVIQVGLCKGPWLPEEDETIITCISSGITKWSEIAKRLPRHRLGKQCRERWANHLNPQLNKREWTTSEDIQLLQLHEVYGNKWTILASYMPGRSENDIKNRWNSATFSRRMVELTGGPSMLETTQEVSKAFYASIHHAAALSHREEPERFTLHRSLSNCSLELFDTMRSTSYDQRSQIHSFHLLQSLTQSVSQKVAKTKSC